MTPRMLAKQSMDLLFHVLTEGYSKHSQDTDIRRCFIYRHARNIHDLGGDFFNLQAKGRSGACRLVLRAMFESLFKLRAAVKHPAFAVEKLVAETECDIGHIKKWAALIGDSPDDLGVKELSVYLKNLREEYGVISKNKWTVKDVAEKAEMNVFFLREYFMLSQSTHASTMAIISHEHDVGTNVFLSSGIFVVLVAVGDFVQVIETDAPQVYIDESARLIDMVTQFHREGAFSDPESE
jgi:Family of unknown function (DUF5677)